MPPVVATCAHLLVNGYDFTADMNELTVNYASEILDRTTFGGSGTRLKIGGLKTATFVGKGYLNLGASQNDPILFGLVGSDATVATIFMNGITEGSTFQGGYAMQSVQASFSAGAAIGKIMPIDLKWESQSPMSEGVVALTNALSTSASLANGTTNGSAYTLVSSSVTSTQVLSAGLHVTNNASGTITAKVQGATSSAFGAPTDLISFAAVTTKSGSYGSTAATVFSTSIGFFRSVITVAGAASTDVTALVWAAAQ